MLWISNRIVDRLLSVRPPVLPIVSVPMGPLPPGLIKLLLAPATTKPERLPAVPGVVAKVPPLNVRLPVPSAEPVVFASTNVPALSVVPPPKVLAPLGSECRCPPWSG